MYIMILNRRGSLSEWVNIWQGSTFRQCNDYSGSDMHFAFWLVIFPMWQRLKGQKGQKLQGAVGEGLQTCKYENIQICKFMLEEEEDVRGGVEEGLQISWSFLEITTPALQLPFLHSSNRHLSIMMMRTTPGRLFTPLSNYRNTHAWQQNGASENSIQIQAVFVCKSFGCYGDNSTFIIFKLTWKNY